MKPIRIEIQAVLPLGRYMLEVSSWPIRLRAALPQRLMLSTAARKINGAGTLQKFGPVGPGERRSMVRLTIDLPEGAFASLGKEPTAFAAEMRLTAAVKWYEMRSISQSRAAEIAGLSRREFLDQFARFSVSPFQYGADEIIAESRA
jgi:predicted HTH domain antitoxin